MGLKPAWVLFAHIYEYYSFNSDDTWRAQYERLYLPWITLFKCIALSCMVCTFQGILKICK